MNPLDLACKLSQNMPFSDALNYLLTHDLDALVDIAQMRAKDFISMDEKKAATMLIEVEAQADVYLAVARTHIRIMDEIERYLR